MLLFSFYCDSVGTGNDDCLRQTFDVLYTYSDCFLHAKAIRAVYKSI